MDSNFGINLDEIQTNEDVKALSTILENLMQFSENLDHLYSDATKELAKKVRRKPNLQMTPNVVILSVPPIHTWTELQTISLNVKQLADRLQQLKEEQTQEQQNAKETFANLSAERDILMNKLEALRKHQPKKSQTDELLRRIAARKYI